MRWRPIKTAPKGDHIMLRYLGLSDEEHVCMGRWVDVPHENVVQANVFTTPHTIPYAPYEGHWEVAYVAILQHGGKWDGHSYEPRSFTVEPTHWMPLPKLPGR